jgi:hypothetical protein
MPVAAMLTNALHAALENRIIASDRVGVHIAAHVFASGVIDGLVVGDASVERQ